MAGDGATERQGVRGRDEAAIPHILSDWDPCSQVGQSQVSAAEEEFCVLKEVL